MLRQPIPRSWVGQPLIEQFILAETGAEAPLYCYPPFPHPCSLHVLDFICSSSHSGANQGTLDINGLDAISIAVNAANADIVTLLRLAKLNEEIKESELGNPGERNSAMHRRLGQNIEVVYVMKCIRYRRRSLFIEGEPIIIGHHNTFQAMPLFRRCSKISATWQWRTPTN